jgi:DNA (cytosine-5)-methyltransferase 1
MNVLDLFSGIGGFSLGLERAGMRTVAFCEIDPWCRRVLAKHWPGIPCYPDVRTLTAEYLAANAATGDIHVDVICGGFPCQDISLAGLGAGLAGERSGLWREYARLIGELRPRYVVVENVAALLGRGLDVVLGDLAALGYDAEWHCIPASAVGAPHRRDRIWIIAHASRAGLEGIGIGRNAPGPSLDDERRQPGGASFAPDVADAISRQFAQRRQAGRVGREEPFQGIGHWEIASQPFVRRGDHGIPHRMDRIRSLGNTVVPQIPEAIGRAIMKASMVSSHHKSTQGE